MTKSQIVEPQIKIEMLEMEDPTFEAAVVKTARARLTNPTSKQFAYTVELYLGLTKAATSGPGQVTLNPGQYQDVNFTLTMPAAEGDYPVYLEVRVAGELLTLFQATETVTIQISPSIVIGPITWV